MTMPQPASPQTHEKSKVFYASARMTRWTYDDSLPGKLEALLRAFGFAARYSENEWVAIKTHFGSEGAHRIVRPVFLRKITDALRAAGARPVVTDTVRIKGLDYLDVANANGLNHLSVGAPVVLADGLYGNDNILIDAGEPLGKVAVASLIHDVPSMVVVSHVKGHINAGYAGAIKNMAMGGISGSHRSCGWKCGRGSMHAIGAGLLVWDAQKCELCMQCQEICPLECITFEQDKFIYDDNKCWRCGRCTRVCPADALEMQGADNDMFMRSLSMATKVVANTFAPGKIVYINFVLEVQPECDCMPGADTPVVQDQGILISDDIVAIEQASMDLIAAASPLPQSAAEDLGLKPGDNVLERIHARPQHLQIEEAERQGLGTRHYELIRI